MIDLCARHDVCLLEAELLCLRYQLLNRHLLRNDAYGRRLLFQDFRHGLRLRSFQRQILSVLALHVIQKIFERDVAREFKAYLESRAIGFDDLKDARDFTVALLHRNFDHDVNEVFKPARSHRQNAPYLVVLFRLFAFGRNLVRDDYGLTALHAEAAQHALKNHLVRSQLFSRRLCQRVARSLTNGCDHLAVLGGEITSPRIQCVASVVLLSALARKRPVYELRQLVRVLNLKSIKVLADAFQQSPFALHIEDAEASKVSVRHAAYEMALADSGSAANGHHQALLTRAAAQRIHFRSSITHLSLLFSEGLILAGDSRAPANTFGTELHALS